MLCYICQEELIENFENSQASIFVNTNQWQLICGHVFHINCISKIRKAECPTCRTPTINIPCIEEILFREQQDKKRTETENELAAYLNHLDEIEQYIEYIEIPINK